jgi:mono/diheme cytochrome c family protein
MVSLCFCLAGCNGGFIGDITPPPEEASVSMLLPQPLHSVFPVFSPDPEKGATVYDQWCINCHGNSGLGDGIEAENLPVVVPPISAIDIIHESNLVEWYTTVSQGHTDQFMPSFSSNLSDRDIWDVLSYIYSIGVPAKYFEEGHLIYLVNCQTCHGESGAQSAELADQLADWSDPASLAGYSDIQLWKRITAGNEKGMPAFINTLDDDQRWAVTSFIRSMGFSNSRAFFESRVTPVPDSAAVDVILTQFPNKMELFGKVRNGSGGDIPLGSKVTLQVFEGNQPVVQRSTILTSDGSYRFSDIDLVDERIYLISILYDGLLYNSQVVRGSDIYQKSSLELPITIYDATTYSGNLVAERVHLFIDFPQTSTMRIVELYTVSNQANEVVVPIRSDEPVLDFILPTGAINLELEDDGIDGRFVLTDTGFGDLSEVYPTPAQHQVLFRYDLPYENKKTINFTMPLDIQSAVIAIPADGVELQSDMLTPSGQRTLEGVLVQLFVADNLKKGENIEVTISGMTGSDTIIGLSEYSNILFSVVLFLTVVVLFMVWFISTRRRSQLQKMRRDDIEYEKSTLLDDIVALDDLFRGGKLSTEVYRNRRNEILADLKDNLKRSGPVV